MSSRLRGLARKAGMFFLAFTLVALLWEGYKAVGPETGGEIPPLGWKLLPRTSDTAMPHIVDMFQSFGDIEVRGNPRTVFDSVLAATWYSFRISVFALVLGVIVGLGLAVVMSRARVLERAIMPYLVISQTIPLVALSPVLAGTKVKLQLQWVTQAQFAGYFAAVDQGFYAAENLDVEIVEAAIDTLPAKVLAEGNADFAISWVPKALQLREGGANVTNIAQVFQRSGTLQVSFKDKNITSSANFEGQKIGNWGFGNEYEIFAALTKAGLDPAKDVTLLQQDFNMNGLLDGSIDAAEAMTYNEYAQVLEAKNPATGELYTPADLNVVSYENEGVGMLQDAIWADQAKLSDPAYCGIAIAFVTASLKGWTYCRDNTIPCRDIVVAKGSKLGNSHQAWQMNEVNALIWPSTDGVGRIDKDAWARTVKLSQETKNLDGATVLTKPVTDGAYTNDIINVALEELASSGVDIFGKNWKRLDVVLQEGGA